MNPWVWHQIGLELSQIHIQSPIKSQGCRDRGDDLGDQPVEVGVSWPVKVKFELTDVINSFIVHKETNIGMLKSGMGLEQSIVWLNNSSGHLRIRICNKGMFSNKQLAYSLPVELGRWRRLALASSQTPLTAAP